MTIQEAYKKISSSEELKKAGIEALKAGKGDEFLKKNGIDLTVEEIKDYLTSTKSKELSREELNMATGGGCGEMSCEDAACSAVYSGLTLGIGCVISYGTNSKSENTWTCW